MFLTRSDIGRVGTTTSSLREKLDKIKEQSKEMVRTVTSTVEVGGTALGFGILHGYKGAMPSYFGMDLDLIVALGAHLFAFSGYAKGFESHLHSIGDGALAYYAALKGVDIGKKLAEDSKKTSTTSP